MMFRRRISASRTRTWNAGIRPCGASPSSFGRRDCSRSRRRASSSRIAWSSASLAIAARWRVLSWGLSRNLLPIHLTPWMMVPTPTLMVTGSAATSYFFRRFRMLAM